MKIAPIRVQLKNNKIVELREARVEDAVVFLNTVKVYCDESPYIPYAKGEFNCTLEEQIIRIKNFINSPNSILVLALHDGEIIGNIDLNGSPRKMMFHTAGVGIGMLKEWIGQGLGTALFKQVLEWAKNNSPLECIWLSVFAKNELGIALYNKMGFEEKGRVKDFFKTDLGEYDDDIKMTLKLK